jgi:GDP-4-dehydro-6-deoxy-D-mannose reductase
LGRADALDVTDSAAVEGAIARLAPTHIINLAGIASPSSASANPTVAWRVHVDGALNLSRAILKEAPDCWLFHVGSGLVYGASSKSGMPLSEAAPIEPTNEYSVTKAAADLAVGAMVPKGLRCLRFRPFNHTGPGQSDAFVIPSFARQIAEIECGLAPPVLRVGNLDVERDFLDVRDVATAYALAIQQTDELEPGQVLNIASGVPRRIGDILEQLLSRSAIRITIEQDPDRLRSSDTQRIIGDATLAQTRLHWHPAYSFETTLSDVLEDWRRRINNQIAT